MKVSNFVAESEFVNSVYPRYRVILNRSARFVLIAYIPLFVLCTYMLITEPSFITESAKRLSSPEKELRLLCPYFLIFLLLLWPLFLWLCMSERGYTKKIFDFMVTHPKMEEGRDYQGSCSITFRTCSRYCSSLEMTGKEMILKDKVTGLINGDLELKGVGRRLKNEVVKFKLSVDQITAMWVAKDLIIMRFCWGETYQYAWDFIIDRSKFIEGTDKDFIKFVEKEIVYKPIVYSLQKFEKQKPYVRLGNRSTNYKENDLFPNKQREVKVFHVHWGPFKKRKRKSKDKEIKK